MHPPWRAMPISTRSPQFDERFKIQPCFEEQCKTCLRERQGASSFCAVHKCIRCDAERVSGDFCPDHWPRCQKTGCNVQNPNNRAFCKQHQCKVCFDGCVSRSSFCKEHKCLLCDAQRSSGEYCTEHWPRCRRSCCKRHQQEHSEFCSLHQCKICMEETDRASAFCTAHKCMRCDARRSRGDFCIEHWPRCSRKGCSEAQPEDSQFCSWHQCKRCPQGREGTSAFCTSHRCTLCDKERTSFALCEEHHLAHFALEAGGSAAASSSPSAAAKTGLACPICLEEIGTSESALALPCAHLLHHSCAIRMQGMAAERLCPLCRSHF